MAIEIKMEYGHYVMYVNNKFYGSYDTIREVNEDRDELEKLDTDDKAS